MHQSRAHRIVLQRTVARRPEPRALRGPRVLTCNRHLRLHRGGGVEQALQMVRQPEVVLIEACNPGGTGLRQRQIGHAGLMPELRVQLENPDAWIRVRARHGGAVIAAAIAIHQDLEIFELLPQCRIKCQPHHVAAVVRRQDHAHRRGGIHRADPECRKSLQIMRFARAAVGSRTMPRRSGADQASTPTVGSAGGGLRRHHACAW